MSYNNKKKFPFLEEISNRVSNCLGIEKSQELDDSLKYLMGDTYFEMRKLTSQLMNEVESLIFTKKYDGYLHGKKLTEEQKKGIREVREDFKEYVRTAIESTWREILNKQKIGIDKFSLVLKDYFVEEEDETDMESSSTE